MASKLFPFTHISLILMWGQLSASGSHSGFHYLDISNTSVTKLAEEILPYFDTFYNFTSAERIYKILEARNKPDNSAGGTITELSVQLMFYNCTKQDLNWEECSETLEFKETGLIFQQCKAVVYEKPDGLTTIQVKNCGGTAQDILSLPWEDLEEKFDAFVKKYNKTYDTTEEYEDRLSVFNSTLYEFQKVNLMPGGGAFVTNKYSDYTLTEFMTCAKSCKYTNPEINEYLQKKCAKDGPPCPSTMFVYLFSSK